MAGNIILMKEVDSFDEGFGVAKKWVIAEQKSLVLRAQRGGTTGIEDDLEEFAYQANRRLTAPGKELMLSNGFQSSSYSQQMGFTRWRTSQAAVVGYGAVSVIERAVLLDRNKTAGIIAAPVALQLAQESIDSAVNALAVPLSSQEFLRATELYEDTQGNLIRQGQTDTILRNHSLEKPTIEAMRVLGGDDSCDYCVSFAGYWTIDIASISFFHDHCRCKVITRTI